jgi:hypothetical protein
MQILKRAAFVHCISIFLFFIFSASASADTTFFIIPKNSTTEIHCDFLSIKAGMAYCKENSTLAAHTFESLAKIIIIKDGKTFQFVEEIKNNSDELITAINTVNKEKVINYRKLEMERQRKLNKQRDEKRRKQEENERYYRKYNVCKDLYDGQCKNECAENKYEYSESCYNACIEANCLE